MKTKLIYKKNTREKIKEFTDESSLVELIKESDHVFAISKNGNFYYHLTYENNRFVVLWKSAFESYLQKQFFSFRFLVENHDILAIQKEDLFNFLTGE